MSCSMLWQGVGLLEAMTHLFCYRFFLLPSADFLISFFNVSSTTAVTIAAPMLSLPPNSARMNGYAGYLAVVRPLVDKPRKTVVLEGACSQAFLCSQLLQIDQTLDLNRQ